MRNDEFYNVILIKENNRKIHIVMIAIFSLLPETKVLTLLI